MSSLAEYIEHGGVILLLLAVISVLIWSVSLYSYGILKEQLKDRDFDQDLCELSPQGASSRMIRQLRKVCLNKESLQDIAAFCYECELSVHNGRFKLLGVLIAVAPLMGLLGTVMGMIDTFDTIAGVGQVDALISFGISRALVTTQAGLTVALPGTLVFVHLLQMRRQLKQCLQQVESRFTILSEEGAI